MRRAFFAALLSLTAVAAQAQETEASANAKLDREFDASDTNKDGALTEAEVEARMGRMKVGGKAVDTVHAKRMADLWFRNSDANGDGKVTKAEAQGVMAKVFARYDLNHDGKVDGAEAAAARAAASGKVTR